MQLTTSALALALLTLLPGAQAAEDRTSRLSKRAYTLQKNMQTPSQFLANFNFFTQPDPSGGIEFYVDRVTAHGLNMTGTGKNGGFRFGAETKQIGGVRKSVRLESNSLYGLGVFVWDVQHMPVGCGTWPALWSYTNNTWPYGGEIDVVEGVNGNTNTTNAASLHTGPNCVIPASQSMTGTMIRNDCNSANGANGNAGVSRLTGVCHRTEANHVPLTVHHHGERQQKNRRVDVQLKWRRRRRDATHLHRHQDVVL